ncbi:MAG TPA: transmembrane 220 family protein [Rhodothermia bacterium]
MRHMNAGMILLFIVAAALQYNEANPLLWIAIYGAAAVLCVMFAIGKFPAILASVFAAGCLVGSLTILWKLLMTDPIFRDEVFNEAASLFIAFLWISTLAWFQHRDRPAIT